MGIRRLVEIEQFIGNVQLSILIFNKFTKSRHLIFYNLQYYKKIKAYPYFHKKFTHNPLTPNPTTCTFSIKQYNLLSYPCTEMIYLIIHKVKHK